MAICYDKLFHLMIDKKISNSQLKDLAGVSANIITRLKRDVSISIHVVDALWSAFSNVCPDSVKIGFPGWDIGMVPQIKTVAGTHLL